MASSSSVDVAAGISGPRLSFSLDLDLDLDLPKREQSSTSNNNNSRGSINSDVCGFEFSRPEFDPVDSILPADQLISHGKLLPLQLTATQQHQVDDSESDDHDNDEKQPKKTSSPSPKKKNKNATHNSSRWKELLWHKKSAALRQQNDSASPTRSGALKSFLNRNHTNRSKTTATDPLIVKTPETDSNPPAKPQQKALPVAVRRRGRQSAESPRMNAAGKVVFLGRSSSNPGRSSSHRAAIMERSYSAASVRVTNVPVCKSVFRFAPLFAKQQHQPEDRSSYR